MYLLSNLLTPFLWGLIPTILWLIFWLKEDSGSPEPRLRITTAFIAGMVAVILVLPVEKLIHILFSRQITTGTLIFWAAAEEIIKYAVAYVAALRWKVADEPIDYIIYMITVALGFSALENTLFLTNVVNSGELAQSLISGNLRFIGATTLHTLCSSIVGVMMALSLFKNQEIRKRALVVGLMLAIMLHGLFNFLIINTGQQIFFVFGSVWISIIVLLLLIEKIKNIKLNKI